MDLYISILLLFLFTLTFFITYKIAKKKENKKILIATYISLGLIFLDLIYITLSLVLVGGIK